jgi:hypothetical protein
LNGRPRHISLKAGADFVDAFDPYFLFLAVGDALPEMPLFLDPDYYIPLPLESSYQKVYHGLPRFWREVIEGQRATPA